MTDGDGIFHSYRNGNGNGNGSIRVRPEWLGFVVAIVSLFLTANAYYAASEARRSATELIQKHETRPHTESSLSLEKQSGRIALVESKAVNNEVQVNNLRAKQDRILEAVNQSAVTLSRIEAVLQRLETER